MKTLVRFLRGEEGTETVEWAIMIGLIAVAAVSLIIALGGWVTTQFQALCDALGIATT